MARCAPSGSIGFPTPATATADAPQGTTIAMTGLAAVQAVMWRSTRVLTCSAIRNALKDINQTPSINAKSVLAKTVITACFMISPLP